MLEDCAYRRLLDWYYLDERPLPLEPRAIYRRVRASSEAEREAVDTILGEFFERTDEGYRHGRCDAEIERSRIKSDARRDAAAKSWTGKRRPANESEQSKPDAIAETAQAIAENGDAKAMHSQEPRTNNQEPKKKSPPTPRSVTAAELPPGFVAFWDAYPNRGRKVQKADCLTRWRKANLETRADEVVAHVRAMTQTSGWLEGYEPAPLTYLNQSRFDDPIPDERRPPTQRTLQAIPTASQQLQQNVIGALTGRSQRRTIDVTDATEVFAPALAR